LDIGTPYSLKGKYRLELPSDFRWDRVPEQTSIQSEFRESEVEDWLEGNVPVAKRKESPSQLARRLPNPRKYR
jgi:hypothetical protein